MISYMEIYNENGYDLLQDNRGNVSLEQLPKVQLQEDDERIILRNLSQHDARDEEEALNLLFFGDTNKMIAETPSNPASSRSHCIFQITVTSKEHDTAKIRRSKLNLVDLAGSERVSRTKIDGTILKEARYINLSLHYLEQVIIALHEKSIGNRSHIPYRNSMMTSILRDSLGGNCKTSMIATVAVEQELINESISTCRFAQRVALIKNDAHVNEEMDLNMVIENLKKEIEMLRAELALLKGGGSDSSVPLPEYEIERLRITVDDYLADSSNQDLIFLDVRKIVGAFKIMKGYIFDHRNEGATKMVAYSEDPPNVRALKEQIIQRDAEIGILVSMIGDKNDGSKDKLAPESSLDIQKIRTQYGSLLDRYSNRETEIDDDRTDTNDIQRADGFNSDNTQTLRESLPQNVEQNEDEMLKVLTKNERLEAFKEFQTHNPQTQNEMQNQRKDYKQKHEQAKELGLKTHELKSRLGSIKSELEARQMEKILSIADTARTSDIPDFDLKIADLREEMSIVKKSYRDSVALLKQLKHECEHLQRLINASKTRMLHDFEIWLTQVKYKGYVLHQVNDDVSRSESRNDQLEDPRLKSGQEVSDDMVVLEPVHAPKMKKKEHSSSSSSRLSVKAVMPLESKQHVLDLTKSISDPRVQQDILAFYRASSNSRNSNK